MVYPPYGVSTPRWNYEQAEVNYHDIWMAGGGGSGMTLSYQNTSNQWNNWGTISGSTWWYQIPGTQYGTPAGWGYYSNVAQPATANEGGYGGTTGC